MVNMTVILEGSEGNVSLGRNICDVDDYPLALSIASDILEDMGDKGRSAVAIQFTITPK